MTNTPIELGPGDTFKVSSDETLRVFFRLTTPQGTVIEGFVAQGTDLLVTRGQDEVQLTIEGLPLADELH